MAKKIPHRRKHSNTETMALPTAENAKWLGIGFLTSLGIVLLSIALLISFTR